MKAADGMATLLTGHFDRSPCSLIKYQLLLSSKQVVTTWTLWFPTPLADFMYTIKKLSHAQSLLMSYSGAKVQYSVPTHSCCGVYQHNPVMHRVIATQRDGETWSVFCLLLGVSSDYAQPITGQVTEVTCPVIGWAQPEFTPSKTEMGPG